MQTRPFPAFRERSRRAEPGSRQSVSAGRKVCCAAIYTLFIWSKLAGIPERTVWRELYWQEPWQSWTAAGNSILLYLALLAVGIAALRAHKAAFRIGLVLTFFSLAALSHIALDFPFHNLDAHRHFWPLSDWKFISPVSYWNSRFHGGIFSIVESILGIVLAVILFRRFKALWVRALLVLVCTAYIGVPLYFSLMLGG